MLTPFVATLSQLRCCFWSVGLSLLAHATPGLWVVGFRADRSCLIKVVVICLLLLLSGIQVKGPRAINLFVAVWVGGPCGFPVDTVGMCRSGGTMETCLFRESRRGRWGTSGSSACIGPICLGGCMLDSERFLTVLRGTGRSSCSEVCETDGRLFRCGRRGYSWMGLAFGISREMRWEMDRTEETFLLGGAENQFPLSPNRVRMGWIIFA